MWCILEVPTTDPYFSLRDPAIALHIQSAEGATYEINKISIEIKCSGIEDALMKPATSKATIIMKITLEEMASEG